MSTLAKQARSAYETERNKPMPDLNHAFIQDNLNFHLNLLYRKKYRMLPELHLDLPSKSRVPDLCIYPLMKLDINHNQLQMSKPPLCAIEILSEKQSMNALLAKRFEYFDFGVKTYWLVVPSVKSVYVYKNRLDFDVFSKNDVLKDEQLDIQLKLAEIFE